MKSQLLNSLLVAGSLLVTNVASAGLIQLSDFDADATVIDFNDGAVGATTYASDILTVIGGEVSGGAPGANNSGFSYTNLVNPLPGVFRLDFASAVSAVGMNVYYNYSDVSFKLFDTNNALLDSYLGSPTQYGMIDGFVGLETGVNNIAYALIDVPSVNAHDLFIDNVIYQTVESVPEPTSLAIIGLGLFGLVTRRAKK